MNRILFAIPIAGLAACSKDGKSLADSAQSLVKKEVKAAVHLVDHAAKSEGGMGAVVELTTDRSAGERLQDRFQRIQALLASQAPCSKVSQDDQGIVTIDFGKLDDQCLFHGHTYAGMVRIRFDQMGDGPDFAVHYEWDGFTDGTHVLDGTRDATWTTAMGATRDWQMSFKGLAILPDDAGPHAGTAQLTAPSGDQLSVVFGRIDADTISATVTGPDGTRTFAISVDDGNPQPL